MHSLKELLKNALPHGEEFELLHLKSIPTEVEPIITSKKNDPNDVPNLTVKIQHFFTLCHNKKVLFALEIHVYFILWGKKNLYDRAERLFFVSKADSNGYSDIKFSAKDVTRSIMIYLLSIDPDYYLKKVVPLERKYRKSVLNKLITNQINTKKALKILAKRRNTNNNGKFKNINIQQFYLSFTCPANCITKICLFTRPADQYLFAESSKNPKKHTLDGAQLLKWWSSILDSILCEKFRDNTEARLRIPGEDSYRVKRYFRYNQFENWEVGDIFDGEPNSLAVFKIPLFADDPKSRFLHQLVEENRILETNLDKFWMELQERQEFKLSSVVSVLGVAGYLKKVLKVIPLDDELISTNSKKHFNCIKNYITGEEYDTSEGALEAYANIDEYLKHRLRSSLLSLVGSQIFERKKKETPMNQPITMLQPRKKVKTT